jgi:dTDP-4-dehydrorhamnose 3,5-epimerase
VIYKELKVKKSYIISLEKREDERGFFARFFCSKEFKKKKLITKFVQANNSSSKNKGTVRGLHLQTKPYEETKIIRCIKGAIFNVVVDLRKNSITYGKWDGEILSANNRKMMYVPKGCANGHLTMKSNSEIIYLSSEYYSPKHETGIKYNDKFIDIKWPSKILYISKKDKMWKPLKRK